MSLSSIAKLARQLVARTFPHRPLMLSFSSRLALSIACLAIVACGRDGVTQPKIDSGVSKVTIGAPYTLLAVGATLQLSAEAANSVGTILVGKTVDWESSSPEVATITSQGLVTGKATGSTEITATVEGRKDTLKLTVQVPNTITLTSDVGDYIGLGATYSYTSANAIISIVASATNIEVLIGGDQSWRGRFQAPSGSELEVGTFTDALRYPSQGSNPGLSWTGEGRGCNSLTGSFTIDTIAWSAGPGSSLVMLAMHFEQHCEGNTPALRATIHWRADDAIEPPGPVTPPSNLWQPPADTIPATGDFVYLESDVGDYIGGGAVSLFQTGISVSVSDAHLDIEAGGYRGSFQGMSSIAKLEPGYYADLMRYPFHNPARGGFDWSGNGRGCNTLTAWFVIDRVNYINGIFAGIEARFEQHCEGGSPVLHGAIRWGQLTS